MSAQFYNALGIISSLITFLALATADNASPSHFTPQASSHFMAQFQKYPNVDEPASATESIAFLGPPPAAIQLIYQGPPVDLVALNRQRFEQDHDHKRGSSESALKRGQFIEDKMAAGIPDRLLASLPDDLSRKVLDTLAAETAIAGQTTKELLASLSEDPDSASIERLSKSCLTVHASSMKPEQLNVTFHLYTRNNPHIPYIMRPQITRLEMIKSSPLDPTKPIKWITHGFHTNVDKSEWMVEAKDKILRFEDSNVILTDWRRGASPALAFYPKAAANAHVVAKMVVKILRRLKQDIDFSRVHLIGHSLGAHIMGFVGSAFTEEFLYQKQQSLMLSDMQQDSWPNTKPGQTVEFGNQLIGRITACDPALPCFGPTSSAPAHNHPAIILPQPGQPVASFNSSDPLAFTTQSSESSSDNTPAEPGDWTPSMWTHLRPDSAIVVEVMHSNPGVMGYADNLGDFDFYPNGFERQPGCGVATGSLPVDYQAIQEDEILKNKPSISSHKRLRRGAARTRLLSSLRETMKRGSKMRVQEGSTGEHLRLAHTLDKIIRPIKDFFKGYTCSHHRAVEYMVESMYYERVPQDRRLDRDFVCQMVGYRCSDYENFKRGFCYQCNDDLDCRALTMSVSNLPASTGGSSHLAKFSGYELSSSGQRHTRSLNETSLNSKRAMPIFSSYHLRYRPQKKSGYFFDTKSNKDFCLNHYHLLVKYRWFRIREAVSLDGFHLTGTLGNISQREPATLHRHTHQMYTFLLTDSSFLGQIESLYLVGSKLRPSMIEHIDLTYMSNLDPRVRALGSARLCRSDQPVNSSELPHLFAPADGQPASGQQASISLFLRCTGLMV